MAGLYKTPKPYEEMSLAQKAVARQAWTTGFVDPFVLKHQKRLFSIIAHRAGLPTRIELSAEDKDILEHINSSKPLVVEVSRRFGKTSLMLLVALALGMKNKGSTFYFCAPNVGYAEELLEAVIPALLATCPTDIRPQRTKARMKMEIYFPTTGSKIKIGGAWAMDNMRGMVSDGTIVDEAGSIPLQSESDSLTYLLTSIIQPTLLTTKGWCVILTTPPPNLQHDYYTIAQTAKIDHRFIRLTIHDNTSLSPEKIQEIKEESYSGDPTGSAWEREYLCAPKADATTLIIPEAVSANLIVADYPRQEYFPYLHRYISFDHGTVDLAVTLFGYYDYPQRKLIVEKELVVPSNSKLTSVKHAEKVANARRELWGDLPVEGKCTVDASSPQVRIDFNDYFTDITWLPPSKVGGLQDVASRDGMVDKIIMAFENESIVIHPGCTMLIETIKTAQWKINASGRREFARGGKIGHADALAALIYMHQSIYKNINPLAGKYNIPDVYTNLIFIKQEPVQSTHKTLTRTIGAPTINLFKKYRVNRPF